ncbi:MAG: hypothetical protein P8L68_05130 [Paracoccaceae bacterium]|nr:hypothetical protein [Paracoccaceae bacterium]
MSTSRNNPYLKLNHKFYSDDTKKGCEKRTSYRRWEVDASLRASSTLDRYKDDKSNPIYLALLEEERRMQKARKFKRTTPAETFADNHFDPFYRPASSQVF